MRTNTQAVLSAYIASIRKRTVRDAAELCRLANSLGRLNEIGCNFRLAERQERRKHNLQTRIKAVLAWSSTTLKAIREATPFTSICLMALTVASADGNAATASRVETTCDRVVTLNTTPWPAYRTGSDVA